MFEEIRVSIRAISQSIVLPQNRKHPVIHFRPFSQYGFQQFNRIFVSTRQRATSERDAQIGRGGDPFIEFEDDVGLRDYVEVEWLLRFDCARGFHKIRFLHHLANVFELVRATHAQNHVRRNVKFLVDFQNVFVLERMFAHVIL